MRKSKPKFSLGQIVATRCVIAEVSQQEITHALSRHVVGDWGDLCEEDLQANEDALASDARLFSKYSSTEGTIFWIITECDRSVTTVLLPSDY